MPKNLFVSVVSAGLLACLTLPVSGSTVEITSDLAISPGAVDGGLKHQNARLCVDAAGTFYLLYVEVSKEQKRALVSVSTDGGQVFGEPTLLSKTTDSPLTAHRFRTHVVSPGAGQVACVWGNKDIGSDDYNLQSSGTTDGGKTWTGRVQVKTARDDVYQGGADLAVLEDGRLLALWVDWRAGRTAARIYAAISSDVGDSWEPTESPYYEKVSPLAAVDMVMDPGHKLYFVYRESEDEARPDPLWCKIDTPKGGTLKPRVGKKIPKKSPSVRELPESGPAAIAFSSSGDVGCLWRSNEDDKVEILFAASANRGSMWTSPVALPATAAQRPEWPLLAQLPGGDLLASWEGLQDGADTLYMTRSSDKGVTWSEVTQIAQAEGLTFASGVAKQGLLATYSSPKDGRIHMLVLK